MKKLSIIYAITCSTLLLSACSVQVQSDSSHIKRVYAEKLADGSTVMLGYAPAASEWKCTQLDKQRENTNLQNIKGTLSFRNGMKVLQDEAIAYANKKHLKTNYIYMYVPSQTQVGSFQLHPFAESESTYYFCKFPPAANNRIF